MNQYLQFLVDGENKNDCSCIPVGAEITLSMIYTEIVNSTLNDTEFTLTVFSSAGNNFVDWEGTTGHATTNYQIEPQVFTASEPGTYTVLFTVTIDDVETTYETTFTICQPGEITYNSCGNYTFTNNFGSSVLLAIKTPTGDVIVEDVTVTAGSDYTFTLPMAGIYIVYYTFTIDVVDADPVTVTYAIQINFFCTIEACLTNLLTQVLCADAMDPCCNICTAEQKAKVEQLRFELNKLLALYGYYLATNFGIVTKYLGVFEMNAEKLEELKALDTVIDKIVEISKQCGLAKCQEDLIKESGCGC